MSVKQSRPLFQSSDCRLQLH